MTLKSHFKFGNGYQISKKYRQKMAHQVAWCFVKHDNLFVFDALRPKSTAMVIAGRSVYLTTLFPGQA